MAVNPEDLDKPANQELLDSGMDEKIDPETLAAVVKAEEGGDITQVGEDTAAAGDDTVSGADDKTQKPDAAKRDQTIPRGRFDEVNTKLHAEREARERAEAELAALKAAPPADIKALRKDYHEALMAGENDKADEIADKIDAENRRQAKEEAIAETDQRAAKREQERAFGLAVAQTLKDYPFLDSTTGNQEAIEEVVEWRDFYIARGIPAHEALTKAAAKVGPAYAEKPEADPDKVVQIDPRKAAAAARNAAAAKAQPAALVAGVGVRAVPTAQVPKTQAEYEKLSDADRESLLA